MATTNKVLDNRCKKFITAVINSAIKEGDRCYFTSNIFYDHCRVLGVEPYEIKEDLRYRKIFTKKLDIGC